MKKEETELELRRNLWAFGMSYKSFSLATKWFGLIIENKILPKNEFYDPICCAGTIAYTRPFKPNRKEKLWSPPNSMIPSEYIVTHEGLMMFRDKIIAHSDTKGTKCRRGQVNQLEFSIKNGMANLLILRSPFKLSEAKKMYALCKIMGQKTEYHLKRKMDVFFKYRNEQDGHYVLSLDPASPALVPLAEDIIDLPAEVI